MPTVDEVKFHLNRAFSFILMFLVCFLLIALVIIVLIARAAAGANSNPSTPTAVTTNTLRTAISAALKEVMANSEWDTIYYKWFNESKLYQQPSACTASADLTYPARSGNLDTVLASKQLRWGFWMQEPWTVTKTPAYTGCEIDLMKAITARIKSQYGLATLDATFSDIAVTNFFQDMKAKLDANQVDAVLSATTITAARATQVDFSCPYFSTMVGLLRTNLQPTIKITAIEHLNSSSINIVTLKGSTLEQYVIDNAPAAKLTTVTTSAEFFAQAESNTVHVAVMDKSPLQYYLATKGKQSCVGCTLVDLRVTTGDNYGVMTKKI